MKFCIRHETRYRYGESTGVSYNEVRLCPKASESQQLISKTIEVTPTASELRLRTDYFGNTVWYLAIHQPHKEMAVTVKSHVHIDPRPAPEDPDRCPAWEKVVEMTENPVDAQSAAAVEFALDSPLVRSAPELAAYARPCFSTGRPVILAVTDLMQRIHNDFEFKPGFTDTATPLSEVLKHRKGVCQDFAQLAIGSLRSLGLPARYVSGYIETLPPPGKEKLKGADVSHAWFSAYMPPFGWVDFDPTNNQIPYDQHIVVGHGRDFSDVTPIKGVIFSAGQHELHVSVDVERIEAAASLMKQSR
ncbi:MAG: transglutaminase family protein [Desulfobacteraceae bacterium]|jgi:transglutaminase-like putative cysteine protease